MLTPEMSCPELHRVGLCGGVAALTVVALCLAIILPAQREASSKDDNRTFSSEGVQTAIDQSASHLINATGEDGLFEYRVNTNRAVKVKPAYNILRHAGTLYATSLYRANQPDQPDEAMRRANFRAGRYLRDQAIAPVPDGDTVRVLCLNAVLSPRTIRAMGKN